MKKVFTKKFSAFIVASMMFSVTTQAQWGLNGTNIFNSNSGNVGVGTNTPVAKFHVDMGASTATAVRLTGTDVRMTINNTTIQTLASGNNLSINAKVTNLDVPGNLILQANTNNVQAFKTGNVGIGTLNPLQKLHVNGASILADNTIIYPRLYASSVVAGLVRDTATWTAVSGVGGRNANTGTTWAIGSSASNLQIGFSNGTTDNSLQTAIQVSGTRNVLLNPVSGNTGIGTLSPGYKLDVSGSGVYAARFINTSASGRGLYASCSNTAGSGYGVLGYGGYIGIVGQANLGGAGARYGVYGYATGGTIANYGVYGAAPANAGGTNSNWAVYASGSMYATSGFFSSDAKLKKDVTTFENAMDKINQLQPRTYNFKTDEFKYMNLPAEKQYGFIAQELEKVFPEMVRKVVQPIDVDNKEKGNIEFKAINYTELIPVLTQALKEQNSEIETLKAAMAEMKEMMKSQGKSINSGAAGSDTKTNATKVYPNPSSGSSITIEHFTTNEIPVYVSITDIQGRQVSAKQFSPCAHCTNKFSMDVSTLSNGVYTVSILNNGKSSVQKIVIAK